MEETTLVIVLLSALVLFDSSGLSAVSAEFSRDYHFVNLRLTWTEAQSYCRERFIDLATVNNHDDNQRLLALSLNSESSRAWIGLYDNIKSWKWSMEDGNFHVDIDSDLLTWSMGEPDNYQGKQHCVLYDDTMKLNDQPCKDPHPFICYDANSTTSYVLVEEHRNWTEAQAYCREHHRDLVSIRSQVENNNIQVTLKNAGVTQVWTGLYREPWAFWSDNSNSTFTNWESNQPNNHRSEQFCAMLSAISGEWGDSNCGDRQPFFCSKEVTKQTIMKVTIQSTADVNSMEIQQQVLQQLRAHMLSKGLNFKLDWRNVRSYRKKQDG
ncbi:macrophage mannose receptor 1-like [Trachinotus anak]|uniref:macrophage mannose receptor 1-like n=1 Tax=Trachinotus anak TaxID=443729 RepID=UPI0039F1B020